MLRDGVTGDWYGDIAPILKRHGLTVIGLAHSLATKVQSGKPVSLQMRPWQLQRLATTRRRDSSVSRAPHHY